jgi:hypothetical protein
LQIKKAGFSSSIREPKNAFLNPNLKPLRASKKRLI